MTELQLEFIKHFGRKELTAGCKIIASNTENPIVTKSAPRYAIEDYSWDIIRDNIMITLDDEFYYIGDWYYFDKKEEYKKGKALRAPWNYECESAYIKDFEILGHPVQWHDVFARMKEKKLGFDMCEESLSIVDENGFQISSMESDSPYIKIDPCLSPMEQPALIEQLLLLIK